MSDLKKQADEIQVEQKKKGKKKTPLCRTSSKSSSRRPALSPYPIGRRPPSNSRLPVPSAKKSSTTK